MVRFGLLLGLLLAAVTGCRTASPTAAQVVRQALLGEAVLVLPPMAPPPATARSGDLGLRLYLELARHCGPHAVFADRVPELASFLGWDNLHRNGQLDIAELAAMGGLVGCRTVIAVEIQDLRTTPPFRAIVTTWWLDVEAASVLRYRRTDIWLRDRQTAAAYREYMQAALADSPAEYVATYSPAIFTQYVAVRTARDLLAISLGGEP